MSDNRKGYINRDNNAVKNIVAITLQHIKDRSGPEHFRRVLSLNIKIYI